MDTMALVYTACLDVDESLDRGRRRGSVEGEEKNKGGIAEDDGVVGSETRCTL